MVGKLIKFSITLVHHERKYRKKDGGGTFVTQHTTQLLKTCK